MKKKIGTGRRFNTIQRVFLFLLVLGFTVNGLYAKEEHEKEAEYVLQESATYSGAVNDEMGEPLPGVTVMIKGTQTGTITSVDGTFSLEAAPGNVLVFSFIGFEKKEVVLGSDTSIELSLDPEVTSLDEVVVVGYGVSKKMDLTGATSNITSEDFNQGAVTNPLEQIAGRAAGVNITQTGSEPGANPTVRIRGITSLIGGNDPLIVVDGIQGNMDLLNQVPPSEIESVDILKDASATAIYGSRGAPGVIIVTTKKAKEGQSVVEYSGSMSVDVIANQLEMFDANQWEEQAEQWGVPYSAWHGSDTDWYDILTQTGTTQNHTLSIGGGTEDFSYRASMAAILQEGVVINSKNDQYIGRIQATQKALDDRLKISVNLSNSITQKDGSPQSVGRADFTSNLITNAYLARPTDPVFASDGSYFYDANVFQYMNPYAVAQEVINEEEIKNQFASFRTDLELFGGFNIGWFGSWRKVSRSAGYYAPASSTLAFPMDEKGVANVNSNNTDEKLMDISLTYEKDIDKHSFKVLGVYEWQKQTYQGHFAQAKGFINDLTTYNALQLGSVDSFKPGDISSYKNDRKLISFLGRINYSFADKYLFTASVRQDGSSVFGEDHKWGTFPSASLAWRVTEESFLQNQDFISNLKLRAGYGVTGNQQGLYPQNSMQLVSESGTLFFNGGLITNFAVTQNSNSDLRWETRYQTNLGVDFGLFGGNLNGTLDVFSATTENLLFDYTVPQPPYPYGSIKANVGSLKNEGVELSLDARVINTSDVTLTLGGNVSLLRNEVEKLSGSISGVELNTDYVPWGTNAYLIEGKPIGTYYILENDGKDPETNEELVVDRNNDGEIDQGNRSEDRYINGSSLPKYTFAFTPVLKYKNFDFSMVWRGAGGNKIFNRIRRDFSLFEKLGKRNLLESAVDKGLFTSKYASDLWLEDGDFLRFENLTIGYTFDTEKWRHISNVRLSVTGRNLALFTDYSGVDPEVNVSGGNVSGVDSGIYPRTRSFAVGLNVSF
ncbi:SusC/RagA family TonB-linked outer membrane protein [Marinilabilia rubra]|uniref:SusC/RagA family TonB-linked outer membrane protein n=1 Tax=Marinilabilia rubra TaxID=2162893 RepID=A0A2U2B6A6_9BACT|nr:TonB-dependent receptor [Marinilabilia rubra]PWD98609.1 SusC/RagA family TonB-linked outer membrane protein [Marinilabilia rubra]